MDTKNRSEGATVARIPLDALWTAEGRRMDAVRIRELGGEQIAAMLRDGAVRVVRADIARPLEWIEDARRYDVWKSEVRDRLVDPAAEAFSLDDFPDGYCYRASEWRAEGEPPIILIERYH